MEGGELCTDLLDPRPQCAVKYVVVVHDTLLRIITPRKTQKKALLCVYLFAMLRYARGSELTKLDNNTREWRTQRTVMMLTMMVFAGGGESVGRAFVYGGMVLSKYGGNRQQIPHFVSQCWTESTISAVIVL